MDDWLFFKNKSKSVRYKANAVVDIFPAPFVEDTLEMNAPKENTEVEVILFILFVCVLFVGGYFGLLELSASLASKALK